VESKELKLIVNLIKSLTVYDSNQAIAARLGLSESTLRGYWDRDKVGDVPIIPDKNVEAFCGLLKEIFPSPLSEISARTLLQGSALSFHNALMPIGGRSWKTFIDTLGAASTLEVVVKPPSALGFGEPDDEGTWLPDAEVRLNQRFYFRGALPWRGEAVLVAEHMGTWHVCNAAQSLRVIEVEGGTFEFPPQRIPRSICLMERTKTGVYRYFVIAVRGHLADYLRANLHGPNPLDWPRLDLVADGLLSLETGHCIVLGATVLVSSQHVDR